MLELGIEQVGIFLSKLPKGAQNEESEVYGGGGGGVASHQRKLKNI